jgi:hypothetical protein
MRAAVNARGYGASCPSDTNHTHKRFYRDGALVGIEVPPQLHGLVERSSIGRSTLPEDRHQAADLLHR